MYKIIQLILFVIIFIISILSNNKLPSTIPIHWNSLGKIDRYGSKYELLLTLPIILIIIYLLSLLFEKRLKSKTVVKKYINFAQTFLILLLGCIQVFLLGKSLSYNISIYSFIAIPSSYAFFYSGYLIKDIKLNKFSGIRTKWTLNSESVWRKTNKLGSKLFYIMGIIMILAFFFPQYFYLILFIPITIISLSLILYSYIEFNKEK